MKEQARKLGIEDRITFKGAQAQAAVLDAYRRADIFVLASRITENGDRDGLPNVLLEAQSQALPCISTRVSAIPELIIDGETGLLVPQEDPDAMTQALKNSSDPALRYRLGRRDLRGTGNFLARGWYREVGREIRSARSDTSPESAC